MDCFWITDKLSGCPLNGMELDEYLRSNLGCVCVGGRIDPTQGQIELPNKYYDWVATDDERTGESVSDSLGMIKPGPSSLCDQQCIYNRLVYIICSTVQYIIDDAFVVLDIEQVVMDKLSGERSRL